jgi:hypothetical protein
MMAALVVWLAMTIAPVFAEDGWNSVKSTHFVISYRGAPADFCEQVAGEAERCYDRITDDLGFLRYDFWLWDNRARIFIFDNAQQYQSSASGLPAWSAGAAIPQEKTIYAFYGKNNFFEHILPHEIGHIIFREFVGFQNRAVPQWLDEGAAEYQERNTMARPYLAAYVGRAGRLIPLTQLSAISPHQLTDRATVELFYAEAVGVIDFLIKRYGKDSFVQFCRSLRDMRDLDRALSYSYSISGVADLDKRWQEYLK